MGTSFVRFRPYSSFLPEKEAIRAENGSKIAVVMYE
jgi:hypothetical protein